MLRSMRWTALCLLIALACASQPALADSLDTAESHAAAGQKVKARQALATWLDAKEPREPTALLRAAQLARALPDIDLINTVRAAAEALEGTLESAPPALDLALGFAYLGLAEESLRLRTGSRVISFYFADATTRADRVPATSPYGETAARLAAASLYAQGDLAAAVKRMAAHRAAVETVSPRFEALAGRLQYDAGSALPTDASGRVTAEAAGALRAAATSLATAADSDVLAAGVRRAARLRLAWTHHRLGEIQAADAAYRATYASGTKEASMVLRGLASLHARDAQALFSALAELAARTPTDVAALDATVAAHWKAGQVSDALRSANRRLDRAPQDPAGWVLVAEALRQVGATRAALDHWARALKLDPTNRAARGGIEGTAQRFVASKPARAAEIYERLLRLLPRDPYIRNNYGFILRDMVSRHTTKLRGGIERIKPDAPADTLALLKRCVAVYAEATALIPAENDIELDEAQAWNLAGIVNDYGLIVHYFIEVQDAALAESLYVRALEMTDYGFKDTYAPNLHRLYTYVFTGVDHDWRWYRIAREAKDAILREEQDADGATVLVPDEQKRAAARRDMDAARARIMQAVAQDDGEDR